jgi:hypothetical protein
MRGLLFVLASLFIVTQASNGNYNRFGRRIGVITSLHFDKIVAEKF